MSKFLKLYSPPERTITFNEDKDLVPIELELPDITTPIEEIEGYGLHPNEQYWRHKPMPPKLRQLQNQKTYKDNPDNPDEKPKIFSPRLKCLHIEKNAAYYQDEIEFIKQEWYRRENGYTFFNKGVPTHITGDNYYYLQVWTIDDRPVRYRSRDRKWWWFWWMVDNDDTCYGMTYPKQRREGATTRVSCIRINRATSKRNFKTGLQSKDDDHAAAVHEENILQPVKNIPFYFMPMIGNRQNEVSELKFAAPETQTHPDYGEIGLNSLVDYRDSSTKAYDGLKRWMLHVDEAGKTENVDVETRWQIQKPCLMNLDPDNPIKGKAIFTSTVDEMDRAGGRQFKNICDGSHYYDRPANNETTTGLYNLFIPASEGMEGFLPGTENDGKPIPFYDKWGNCDSASVEKYLLARRENFRKQGKIREYIEECRLFPLTWADCWKSSGKLCNFNLLILEERLDHYRNGNPDKVRGNFVWTNGQDSTVKWEPSEAGKFWLSWNFPNPGDANRFHLDPEGRRMPGNKHMFVAGADPYNFKYTKSKKHSNGAGTVFYKYDKKVDGGTDIHEWKSNRFICTYDRRELSKEAFAEELIKMCVYFGCEINPEINVPFVWDYFSTRGYGHYLYYKFDLNTGKLELQPGSHTNVKTKEELFADTQSYIEQHGHRECHDELLAQWKVVEDDLSDYDLMVAAGKALEAARQHGFNEIDEHTEYDLRDYIDDYDITKLAT